MIFSDYRSIVDFLMKSQAKPLDEAMQMAQVPIHYEDQMRSYFAGPLLIVQPLDLIVDYTPSPIQLCQELPDTAPQYFFNAFQNYLLNEKKWSRPVIEGLGKTNGEILKRLPQPNQSLDFKNLGLVVGHIQSGKTASMATLINKAADQGYRLFIILAGLYNDLRSQTQKRMDQEVAGDSDHKEDEPLVKHDPSAPKWVRFTKSGLKGDFSPGSIHPDWNPKTPKIAVIKKNAKVIEKFTAWLRRSSAELAHIPVLIIDDEADQASINTNYGVLDDDGDPIDPSKINLRIRELLACFPKSSYVGYTATPFANVLIDVDESDDLYPRDFIACLPEPAGYFGPEKLFGLGLTPSDLSPEESGGSRLDILRPITTQDLRELTAMRPASPCPQIISDALLAYLLSCCSRLERGHEKEHFSMFIHPSHRTDDHSTFASVVEARIANMRTAIGRPKHFPDFHASAEQMWNTDFRRVTTSLPETVGMDRDFQNVWGFAKQILDSFEIITLNSRSEHQLDYSRGRQRRYIIVGGNRLSRGLTLEGLSVSVFLRDTDQYDTLLQMGRWFGFRPDYHDLTRIYVEPAMARQYADLARVELELRRDLHKYTLQPNPPSPLGLKPVIRSHPSMAITSPMKLGASRPINLSFSGATSQTINFHPRDLTILKNNLEGARAWIKSLPEPFHRPTGKGLHIWKSIPSAKVLQLLGSYAFGAGAGSIGRVNLTNYITRQNAAGELIEWDIVIPRGSQKLDAFAWGNGINARKVHRSPTSPQSIGALVDPRDIVDWKDKANRGQNNPALGCLLLYVIDRNSLTNCTPPDPSFFTDQTESEDVLGLVIDFPISRSAVTVPYVSQ